MIIMLILAIKEMNLLDEYSQSFDNNRFNFEMRYANIFNCDSLCVFFIFVSHFPTLFSYYVHSPFLSLSFHSIFFSANNGPEILMVYFFP